MPQGEPSNKTPLSVDPFSPATKTPLVRQFSRTETSEQYPHFVSTPEESYKTKCRKHTTSFQSHRSNDAVNKCSDVMAPTPYMVPNEYSEEPISRTYQYRKVMKPMLERKRRARINRCLDELKELMVTALQSEGENVSKLEKADILELTVRHLHGLKRQHQLILPPEQSYADRFRAGFTQCAKEVSQFLTTPTETVDAVAGRKLLQHLGACVRQMENVHYQTFTPPTSPAAEAKKVPMWRPW